MAKKKGKYADVMDGLNPAPPADLAYQERVDMAKFAEEPALGGRKIVEVETTDVASLYAVLRHECAKLDAAKSLLNVKVEACEQVLVSRQEAQLGPWGQYGVEDNALRLATGDTIRVQEEPSPRVVDKEAFRLWCIENGYERQLQLWPTTTAAIAKERLLAGEAQPDGVEVNSYKKVVFTEAK